MKEKDKTKGQLTKEVTRLRRRVADLEASGRRRNKVEEELRMERDKAQQYLDIAEVMFVALNKKGEITLINRKGNQILGYKEAELLGKNWFTSCVPSHFRKGVKGIFRKLMAGAGKTVEFYENTVLTKSSREKIIAWHNTLLKDSAGNIIGTLSSGEDITEHKRSEEALQESEEKYRELINGMNDTAWVIDFEGNFIDVNNAAVEVLGYSREELLSMGPHDIDNTLDAEEIRELIKKMPTDKIQLFESTHTAKDGKVIPVEIKSSLVTYQGKRAILSIARDITERKQSEEALRESEERFRTVVETMRVGMGAIDEKGMLTYVNEYFSKMLGYTMDEMIGRSTLDFFYDEEGRKTQEEIFAKRRAGMQDPSPYEVTWRKKDGQKVYAILSPTPTFDAGGRYVGSFAIHTDITERKQAEEKLQESESRYRTLFNSAGDAIFILDPATGRFIDVNQVACERLGYSRKELLQVAPIDIDSPEYAPLVQERIEMLRQRGHLFFETVHVRRDGTFIPTEINSRLITYSGKPAVLSIARDITDRREAEKELRHSYQELHEMLVTTVNALATTVEMKDQYTAGHQPRSTELACAIAEEMGLSQYRIEGIRMAGAIHDIGKIVVPAEILNKPGPLTEIQYEMIKMHPRAGYDIVKGIKFPWPVAQMVLQHHELMDGSGYPDGLTGGQIMLEARILTVANVVEAMISHRPYRPALTIEKALEEISKNKGILYDATVVDACLKLFAEKRFTFD
jgi:PAS domain S-box-containing protein